ncbi:MAG: hypothetical protein ABSD13_01155 [Candidatus Korobacteraceae bacterium]|jgi:hypothetical protein
MADAAVEDAARVADSAAGAKIVAKTGEAWSSTARATLATAEAVAVAAKPAASEDAVAGSEVNAVSRLDSAPD